MKLHSTNYYNTLIEIAEDSKLKIGTKPPVKSKKTIAEMQFELISNNPYKFTSDDVLFYVYAEKNGVDKKEFKKKREEFFSKGQPCFRASPLTKMYGFGVHSNNEGKIALFGIETEKYKKLVADKVTKKIKAMKTNK